MTKRPKREGVMLAYSGNEGRIRRLGDRIFCQPKYRGERCRIEWFYDDPVMISSFGNEFTCLPHIKQALKDVAEATGEKIPFDGELYDHGRPFDGKNGIHAIASRRENIHPEYEALKFHTFDIQWQESSQLYRIQNLFKLKEDKIFEGTPLVVARTEIIAYNEWLPVMKEYVEEGYEGIILRSPLELYKMSFPAQRSVGLIKIKPTEIDEYKILSVYEAISKENIPKGMVGGFTVQDEEGNVFNVGAGKLKHNKRIKYWKNRDDIPGKMLIVKHEPDKTKGGVPICAVAVDIKL